MPTAKQIHSLYRENESLAYKNSSKTHFEVHDTNEHDELKKKIGHKLSNDIQQQCYAD